MVIFFFFSCREDRTALHWQGLTRVSLDKYRHDERGFTNALEFLRKRQGHPTRRCVMHKALYLAVAVVALMLMAKPAAALQQFVFFNAHTGMCLEPQNESTAVGAPIVQQPSCSSSGAQRWIYLPGGSAGFQFQNAQTGLCLDARGGAANHTPVQQWPCNGISNEKWQVFVPAKGSLDAPVQSRVAGSKGFCLDIPGGQATVGLAMQIYGCNQTVSQLWQLTPASSVYVPIVSNTAYSNTLTAAVSKITLYGLMPKVNNITPCFEGHTAIVQAPNAGSFALPNSAVVLTVYTCAK
jgi:hypothetical protein